MSKLVTKGIGRKSYTPDFKTQTIALATELDSVPEAAEKLVIKSVQALASWIRHHKKKTLSLSTLSCATYFSRRFAIKGNLCCVMKN